MEQMKRCSNPKCGEKPLTEFDNSNDGRCKSCRAEYRRKPENKARQAVSMFRYRLRQSGAAVEDTLTSHDVAMVLNEGTCSYCQRELTYSDATVDHVVSLNRGGANTFTNVVCACKSCNVSKSDKPALLHMIQSCEPYATKKLLERLALRRGVATEEIYSELVIDAQEYYRQQAVSSSV